MKSREERAKYARDYWNTHPEVREKQKARQRAQWKSSPELREAQRKRAQENARLHTLFIIDYLREHYCVDCSEKDVIVLQFDHLVTDKKNMDVTGMGQHSRKRVLAEIAKCEVVCANCHVRRTLKRANTLRWQVANAR